MTEKLQLSGLCINCLNAEECSYRVNHTRPIIFCEEFSCIDTSESTSNIIGAIPKIENAVNPLPKGICSNCKNIVTCKLQETDDIVINCEEYR